MKSFFYIFVTVLAVAACSDKEPSINNVKPVFGLTRGDENAIISGRNIDQLMPVTVYFGDNKVLLSSLKNGNELWVTTPPNDTEENVDIRIIGQNGVEFLMEGAFEYVRESKMAECVNVSKALNGTPVIDKKSQR